MRHRRRLCGLAALLWASALHASDYQFEGAITYAESDGDMTETDTTGLSAAWFLAPVKTSQGPLSEAGFLSQQSSIRYSYSNIETEIEPSVFIPVNPPPFLGVVVGRPRTASVTLAATVSPFVNLPTTELDRHALSYAHVHKASGWFAQFDGSLTEGDGSHAFLRSDFDGYSYRVSVGRYITPSTTVRAYIEQDDQKTKTTFSSTCQGLPFCVGITSRSSVETETLSYGVAAKHVGQAFGHYYAVSGFLQHDEADTESSFSSAITENPLNLPFPSPISVSFNSSISDIWKTGVNATWYFKQNLGVTAGYAFTDTRSNQDQTYSMEGRWFVTPRFELRLHLMRTHLEGPRGDIDHVGLTIGGRV